MKRRSIFWLGLAALGALTPVSAEWQLMDNFEQWQDEDRFTDAEDIGWHATSEKGADEYRMIELWSDPGNIALWVKPGGRDWNDYDQLYCQKELPGGGILPGETGTLFWRTYWDSWGFYYAMGTTDRDLEFDSITGLQTVPGEWGDYNALMRADVGEAIDLRDGSSNVESDPPVVVSYGAWDKYWMVVENTWDTSTSPPTCTGVFSLYFQSPNDRTPVLVRLGSNPPKDKADFRRPPADEDGTPRAIIWLNYRTNTHFMFYTCSSCGFHFLDDFYFSKGANLSDPLLPWGSWSGYAIENDLGDVNTDSWMQWINVRSAPYIWVYAVDGWFYMEDSVADAQGAWGYFFK